MRSGFGWIQLDGAYQIEMRSHTKVFAPKTRYTPSSSIAETGAIVIGGNYRALGIVRSLGRHGIPVWVLTDEHRLAGYSRYATRSLVWPKEEARQLDLLHELCAQHGLGGWVLFPSGDEDAGVIARHHASLSQEFRLTVPPWETLSFSYDKRLTHQLAADLGLPFPLTLYPRNQAEVESLPCEFPVILKPAIKEGFNAFVHAKAWRATKRDELYASYRRACALVPPEIIMVQELIPGGGEAQYSYAALCESGKPLVSLVARRTRQYPVDFGRLSTFVETVDEPEVEKASLALLAALGYTGIVEIEFKRDPRNGQYKLLDINPRVWGWHTLARQYGGDFPYLFWQLLHGNPMAETRITPGLRWLRLTTDLLAAGSEIIHGHLTLAAYFRSFQKPLELAVLSRDDPLPGLFEVLLLTQVALGRKAL